MNRPMLTALAFLCLAAPLAAVEPDAFPFKDGDKPVVFIGDSITEQRQYTTFIESFLLTRFPDWKLTFRNTGVSGDTMGLNLRGGPEAGFKRDIQPLKPAIALINFGMNDGRRGEGNIPAYRDQAKKLIGSLRDLGSRVVLLTPSPEERYEEGQPGGSAYNTLLRTYNHALAEVSQETRVPLVDQFEPFLACIDAGRKSGILGQKEAPRLIPDAVHPNSAGHFVMASSILKGLKAPSLVSTLEIDAAAGTVTASENCEATVEKKGEELAITRRDRCLPWGIPEDCRMTLKIPGFTPLQDLDRYTLAVKNLKPGKWQLASGDEVLATWTAEQLAQGVSLADISCPSVRQSLALHQAVAAKNNLFFERWRGVQLAKLPEWMAKAFPSDSLQKAKDDEMARLDKAIAAAEARIDEMRQPKPQSFILRPAAP